jgi:hypothetical protein
MFLLQEDRRLTDMRSRRNLSESDAFELVLKEVAMRTLFMLAAAGGISCLTAGASAAPLTAPRNAMVQKTDWYCGPNCQRHRYWEQRRAERREEWRESRSYPHRYYYGNQYYRGY